MGPDPRDGRATAVQGGGMQILLEVQSTPEGRLTGTAEIPGGPPRPFSGNLELLAHIEALSRPLEPLPGLDTEPTNRNEETHD